MFSIKSIRLQIPLTSVIQAQRALQRQSFKIGLRRTVSPVKPLLPPTKLVLLSYTISLQLADHVGTPFGRIHFEMSRCLPIPG